MRNHSIIGKVSAFSLLSLAILSGCSTIKDNALYGENGLIHDRSRDYQQSSKGKALEIPPQLAAKPTYDTMEIPNRSIAETGTIDAVKRPEYFYADSGTETVNLKSHASGKILIVDEPINLLWAKAKQFMEFNNLGISKVDPSQGAIESEWITIKGDQLGVVEGWLKKLTFQNVKGDSQNKLRIQLKQDAKNPQRTSITMEQVQYPIDQTVSAINWAKDSKNLSYKSDMLYELLRFMSKATNGTEGRGLLASSLKRSEREGTVLFGRNANGRPALKIAGSIENAWKLVDQSLALNNIDVGTKDKSGSTFYLTFTSVTPKEVIQQGFFEWLHSERGPLTISSFSFGADTSDDTPEGVSYSKNGQVSSSKEIAINDPSHPANQEGYKIWLGGKVIYNFSQGLNRGFFNSETNLYELTAPYQLKLKSRGNSVFVTVLTDKAKAAAAVPAEELLWSIKDNIPRG